MPGCAAYRTNDRDEVVAFLVAAQRGATPHPLSRAPDGRAEIPDALRALKAAGFLISRFELEAIIREAADAALTLSADRRHLQAIGAA